MEITTNLPIVIAATGHRNLSHEQYDAIRICVRQLFDDLAANYPHNPLVLLSPLAEGADILAAEVALEAGVILRVPLPKPLEEHLKDFELEVNRQKFLALCSRAEDVCEPPYPATNAPQGINYDLWKRDYPFANLSAFLSSHCHVLLAIWGGEPSRHRSRIPRMDWSRSFAIKTIY